VPLGEARRASRRNAAIEAGGGASRSRRETAVGVDTRLNSNAFVLHRIVAKTRRFSVAARGRRRIGVARIDGAAARATLVPDLFARFSVLRYIHSVLTKKLEYCSNWLERRCRQQQLQLQTITGHRSASHTASAQLQATGVQATAV
jgi:hypothetical protein